jgi:hypothetical protein
MMAAALVLLLLPPLPSRLRLLRRRLRLLLRLLRLLLLRR